MNESTDKVRTELRGLIEKATTNTSNIIFGLKDTYGNVMHSAKIIEIVGKHNVEPKPEQYPAVYHYPVPTIEDFIVGIATSSDFINWKQISALEEGSSQPNIIQFGSTFLMTWEQTEKG